MDNYPHSISGSQTGLQVREITSLQRISVARQVARLQPDTLDVPEAMELLAGTKGWFLSRPDNAIVAWLAVRLFLPYRTAEITTMGADDRGNYALNDDLRPLLDICSRWATLQGTANLRYIIHSRGLSCHNIPANHPGALLTDLKGEGNYDFQWLLAEDFTPCGILPNIYGFCYHGVMMVKVLEQDFSTFIDY